jgi:hypothetical protein
MPAAAPGLRRDAASPRHWRVLIAVPPGGFGGQLAVMHAWLDAACGPAGWESASAGFAGIVNDAIAFYFKDRAMACAFIERFSCGYRTNPKRRL